MVSPRPAARPGWDSRSVSRSPPRSGTRSLCWPMPTNRSVSRGGRCGTRPSRRTVGIRDGAWLAEATALVDLTAWPDGTRLILRKERPHPGAQLTFTDLDGLRVTAFITDTPPGVVRGQ